MSATRGKVGTYKDLCKVGYLFLILVLALVKLHSLMLVGRVRCLVVLKVHSLVLLLGVGFLDHANGSRRTRSEAGNVKGRMHAPCAAELLSSKSNMNSG